MTRCIRAFTFATAFLVFCVLPASGQDKVEKPDKAEKQPDVRIAGPASTKPILTGIVSIMKKDKGLLIGISTDFTSSEALDALAQEKADIALITRPLGLDDRAEYPYVDFQTVPVGMEVVALGVSSDLWDAGLHTITKEAMRDIYERKTTNWKNAGGPDEKINFVNFKQGQGIWEIFAEWLYGDNRKAPIPKVQYVGTNDDARAALEFTPGTIAPLDAGFVDGSRCHALDIDLPERIARPMAEDVAAGIYPLVRPIFAVVICRPSLAIRTVTEFFISPSGQELVKKSGAMGMDAAPKPTPNPYY